MLSSLLCTRKFADRRPHRRTRFMILSSQRSGSAWLVSTLNKLENSTAYGELFLSERRDSGKRQWDSDFAYPRYIEIKPAGLVVRPFSTFSYLKAVYRESGTVGFKMMYSQLRLYPETLAYLIRHRIWVIHLVRLNHLNVVISGEIKARTGQAHLLSDQSAPEAYQITLDSNTLLRRLKVLRRNILIGRGVLRWSGLPHIEIDYEDLAQDPSRFNLIWNFLSINVKGGPPQSDLVKMRKGGHADVISNYDQVKNALANSQFAELID